MSDMANLAPVPSGAIPDHPEGAFYVFDEATVAKRIDAIRGMLPEGSHLCYCVKANPFLTHVCGSRCDRLELCSPGEEKIAASTGIPSASMLVSGVYKSGAYLRELAADPSFAGVITIESMEQYRILRELSGELNRTIRVMPRLTNASQFGVNREDITAMIEARNSTPHLVFCGIHYFSGTQKTSTKKIRRELLNIDVLLTKLRVEYGWEAAEFEYGPGFPVNYFEEDHADEMELYDALREAYGQMVNRPTLTVELGRSIAASCGSYYTHVVDLKTNRGENYALTDGGMHQFLYFGQFMGMKHPLLTIAERSPAGNVPDAEGGPSAPEEERIRYQVVGALCSMNDILVKDYSLPALHIGDTLCLANAGAYSMTEGMALFLSRDLPAVYLRREDGTLAVMRRTYETAVLNTPQEDAAMNEKGDL